MFQSLTGSIHTSLEKIEDKIEEIVSISQVQFTHNFIPSDLLSRPCFNPSQVQFTHYYTKSEIDAKWKFQSLTGSIHTGLRF
jgi:hypothetical protein